MNPAHLHLVLNHVPVIGTIFTMFLLLVGILKKSDDVKKAAMLVLILTSLITIPVYVSGDGAEEMIEGNYQDVDEQYIGEHEDFALYSFIAMDIAGAIAILSMFLYKKPKELTNSFAMIMLVIVLIVNVMMGYTANLGGKIHHPEIRNGGTEQSNGKGETEGNNDENKVQTGSNEMKDAGKSNDKDEKEQEESEHEEEKEGKRK